MGYQRLEDVSGIGKSIVIRDKHTGEPFTVGLTEDEVSTSDGEQKYFVQFVRLEPRVSVENDRTRVVFRIGYYTQRTDGPFCLGFQYTPILTPSELRQLIEAVIQKGWLETERDS